MKIRYLVSTEDGMRIIGKEFEIDLDADDAVRLYYHLQASMPHLAEILRREQRQAEKAQEATSNGEDGPGALPSSS